MRRHRLNHLPTELGMFDEGSALEKKKIRLLVIDDHAAYCSILKEHAELCNYQYDISCEFAESGEEAHDLMKRWSPSVVLVDAHMPTVDCLELLSRWKDTASPIIVTSNERSGEIESSVLSRGAAAYVTKDDSPEEVDRLIERIASLAPMIRDLH